MSIAEENLIKAMQEYLAFKGEDITRQGIIETPERFVKQLNENLAGYEDAPELHAKVFANDGYTDLIFVRDIDFSSQCEHHMVPFVGKVDIAYLPKDRILGLSKFARIIDAYSKRLQVQEKLTNQIADVLIEALNPNMLIVKVTAQHTCMTTRGVKRPGSTTETIAIKGDVNKYHHYLNHFQLSTQGARL